MRETVKNLLLMALTFVLRPAWMMGQSIADRFGIQVSKASVAAPQDLTPQRPV
jgi:hypothetical protein